MARPLDTLSAGALTLERWRKGDLEQLREALSTTREHLLPGMPWAAHLDCALQARFLRESEEGWERGDRFEYALRDAQRALSGSIGLIRRIGPRGLEIGYWVYVAHTRSGVASLSAAAVTEAALALPGVEHVEIHHDEANIASGRVPRRLGFRSLGTLPQAPTAPGVTGVEARWQMTAREFPASPAYALLAGARAQGAA